MQQMETTVAKEGVHTYAAAAAAAAAALSSTVQTMENFPIFRCAALPRALCGRGARIQSSLCGEKGEILPAKFSSHVLFVSVSVLGH